MDKKDLLVVESGELMQPFNYAVGMHGSKFLSALKDKKVLGIKCGKCGTVYVPPRRVCGPCFTEMDEWVEVGPLGVISTFTILRYAFIDPETGKPKPVPYGYGLVRFDGSDTCFQHFIDLTDESKVKIGARVEPVFAKERRGTIRDIEYFRVLSS